jgi:hypothetical protein
MKISSKDELKTGMFSGFMSVNDNKASGEQIFGLLIVFTSKKTFLFSVL